MSQYLVGLALYFPNCYLGNSHFLYRPQRQKPCIQDPKVSNWLSLESANFDQKKISGPGKVGGYRQVYTVEVGSESRRLGLHICL